MNINNNKNRPPFVPSKYAKKYCRTCKGRGLIHIHVPIQGKVVPKQNNVATQPCGCARKRYERAIRSQSIL